MPRLGSLLSSQTRSSEANGTVWDVRDSLLDLLLALLGALLGVVQKAVEISLSNSFGHEFRVVRVYIPRRRSVSLIRFQGPLGKVDI